MRALIRHLKSGLYLKSGLLCAGDWRWTAKREKAWDFATTFQALKFAWDNHLRRVEVVLAFGEARYDLAVSQPPES
jgi:hypothetical protein